MVLSYTLIFPLSQLQTQQVMTSQIVIHRIFNSCAHFIVKIDEKFSLNDGS